MSITDTRPETEASEAPAPAPQPAVVEWLTGTDHKRIGAAFVVTAAVFGLAAVVATGAVRLELWSGGRQLVHENTLRYHTLAFTSLFWLALAPAFWGLATHLVPLQIGARRLAFPRAQALAYWLWLGGGVLAVGSYIGDGPGAAAALVAPPGPASGGDASQLWILGMGLVSLAAVIVAANLLATLVTMRAPGMTFDRVPVFAFAVAGASLVTALAVPVFAAGLAVHEVDVALGGSFWAGEGSADTWAHLLWLHARPELVALLVMAAGVVSEVVATFARRPLPGHRRALFLVGAMAAASLVVWAFEGAPAAAPLAPTFAVGPALVYAPLAGLGLMWLATLGAGRPRPSAALAHALGAVVVLLVAAAGAVSAAAVPVGEGTAWAEGHLGLALVAPAALAAAAGLHYWAPKIWGRRLNEWLGYLAALLLTAGFVGAYGPYYAGLRDAARYSLDATGGDLTAWDRLATLGWAAAVAGFAVVLVNLGVSIAARRGAPAGDDPWEGATLEWTTTSPPPYDNFPPGSLPGIRSEQPAADARAGASEGAS
jgi:heme/copper-type cytochrome/quinol oxidase subunit 1